MNSQVINSDRYENLISIRVNPSSAATELYSLGWFVNILILYHTLFFSIFYSTIFSGPKIHLNQVIGFCSTGMNREAAQKRASALYEQNLKIMIFLT